MRALLFGGKETISYERIEDPSIEHSSDVIVQVSVTAICGSDLHPYHEHEKGLDHGTVMGHEFLGQIVEVGNGVKGFRKGDWVVSPFTTNCGQCFYCKIGLTCRCIHGQLYGWRSAGAGLHGGQAEFVRVPLADTTLVRIDPGASHPEQLMIGDIFSTGYFAADQGEVQGGSVCVVIGAGPVGLMAAIGAADLGAEQIYVIDSVPDRLAIARQFGAEVLNFEEEGFLETLFAETDGRGADTVIEAVGNSAASKMALEAVRPGGVISSVGVHNEPSFPFSPLALYDKNVTYKSGRCPARKYMNKLLGYVQEARYPIHKIISHQMSLASGAEAYHMFDKKLDQSLKILLHPEG